MEVYDVRWVTNFDEKMAEINGNNVRKKGEYNMHIYILYYIYYKISMYYMDKTIIIFY